MLIKWPLKLHKMDGLECGQKKICYGGECVAKHDPKPINGGWTEWIQEGGCSLKCGGGVKLFRRYCTKPVPKYGGSYCSGESSRFEMCNMQPCRNQRSTNHSSCDTYQEKPCTLFCSKGDTLTASDGTPCSNGYTGKCLGGYCRPVDCKGVLFGDAVTDLCGQCQGHNDTCHHHEAHNLPVPVLKGTNKFPSGYYYDIITIPKGSINIHVELINNNDQLATLAMRYKNGPYFPDLKSIKKLPFRFEKFDYEFEYNMEEKKKRHILKSITQNLVTSEDIMLIVLDYKGKGAKSISYSWYTQK